MFSYAASLSNLKMFLLPFTTRPCEQDEICSLQSLETIPLLVGLSIFARLQHTSPIIPSFDPDTTRRSSTLAVQKIMLELPSSHSQKHGNFIFSTALSSFFRVARQTSGTTKKHDNLGYLHQQSHGFGGYVSPGCYRTGRIVLYESADTIGVQDSWRAVLKAFIG